MTLTPSIQAGLDRLVADVAADPAVQGLQVYVVGGAVRDALLMLPAGDRDWVVVGAEPQELARRGFTPVGGDFPVFLHPVTHEEYALARTERKTGRGYKGFVFHAGPDVSLADDLQRRDLTVNAIALDLAGKLHDPCGGQLDLQARVLRHIGQAFAEDPVRILRLGRFASRFSDFTVAEETLQLCRQMVADGEADALVPERVWREISRTLAANQPGRMFEILAEVGALARIAPEWDQVWGQPSADTAGRSLQYWLQQLSHAQTHTQSHTPTQSQVQSLSLAERYALLCLPVADAAALHARLKVPVECADLARLLAIWRDAVASKAGHGAGLPSPELVLERVERCDGLRKPARFEVLVQLAALAWPEQVNSAGWLTALQTILAVDAGAVARTAGQNGPAIREAVRQARLAALKSSELWSS